MSIALALARVKLKWRCTPYTSALLPLLILLRRRDDVRPVWSALVSVLERRLGFGLRFIVFAIASFKFVNAQKWSGRVSYAWVLKKNIYILFVQNINIVYICDFFFLLFLLFPRFPRQCLNATSVLASTSFSWVYVSKCRLFKQNEYVNVTHCKC